MPDDSIHVSFQPMGRDASVARGSTVREAGARCGVPIDYPCGGQGSCGKCRVHVDPAPPPTETEMLLISAPDLLAGMRLACRCRLEASATVQVPNESLLGASYQILDGAGADIAPVEPPVSKQYVALAEPTLEDDISDQARLRRAMGTQPIDVAVLRRLGRRLRSNGFSGTAVIADGRITEFEAGNTTNRLYGAAFDIGTTTLVGALLDLNTGKRLAGAGRMNPQIAFGDDVLSRISHAGNDGGLDELQQAVISVLNEMLETLAQQASIQPEEVYYVTLSGNTTMQHLLAGIDPTPLGCVPFVSAFTEPLRLPAADLGLRMHPGAAAFIFPVIGGFVGGDTVAGILATGLANETRPTLFVDIGTNGEIVLVAGERLTATSCAAGPAFEGAKILHGMRAANGAIESVQLNDSVQYDVIGNERPVGMCGSALIDLMAGLLDHELVTPEGAMLGPGHLPAELPRSLARRITMVDGEPAFVVAFPPETQTNRAIVFTQRDVRELQLATAAVRSGISIMLKRAELAESSLERVLVAGAFGNYVKCASAQRMGLLPAGVPTERIEFSGNTSLTGARMALVSRQAQLQAQTIAETSSHIDLSTDLAFHETFVECLFFPTASLADP